jgi:hypothetical protein
VGGSRPRAAAKGLGVGGRGVGRGLRVSSAEFPIGETKRMAWERGAVAVVGDD